MNAPEEQSISGKAYDLALALRLWRFVRPHRRLFFLSLLLLPVHQGFNLAQPLLLKIGIDAVSAGDGLTLMTTGLLFAGALAAEAGTFFFQYYLSMKVAQRCLADLRVELFSHVQRLPMSYFDRNPVGRLMTRMTTDVEVLQEMFAAGAMNLVADLVLIAVIVAIMMSLHVGMALVSLALIPFLLIGINVFRLKARQTYRLIRTRIARVNAYLGEAIPGMAVIQLFNRQERSFEEFDDLNRSHRDAIKRSNVYEASLFSMVEAAGSLSIALLLWYGGGEVLQGVVGIGTFVAFSEYIRRLFVPLRDFSNKYAVIQAAMTAAERIFELLDTAPEQSGRRTEAVAGDGDGATPTAAAAPVRALQAPPDAAPVPAAEASGASAIAAAASGTRMADSPATGNPAPAAPATRATPEPAGNHPVHAAVEFDNVWFSYRPNDPVLKGVSFRIEPGERVAVIGATGSGKTTTIKLMSRFYDVDSGAVRLGGRDVREWELDDLRRHMGTVLQDVFLFSGDILSNLKLGNESIPEERIRAAVRSANAEGFIRRMPGGLRAAVRERGNNLSAGQRQLLALVRMFVLDPEILVLDEATSSVDTETEFLVQGAFEKIMANRTCLVIAHRLSTIRNADRILVFHRGVIREMGSHAELMEKGGVYYRLHQLQFQGEGSGGAEAGDMAADR
ncbi:MAG: ABC transporter ATP-binding protein [Deltaproteobacteria bacterium]|nr:ABC transporter ATP-binding protein [Deltaproteobacteria bacterium]